MKRTWKDTCLLKISPSKTKPLFFSILTHLVDSILYLPFIYLNESPQQTNLTNSNYFKSFVLYPSTLTRVTLEVQAPWKYRVQIPSGTVVKWPLVPLDLIKKFLFPNFFSTDNSQQGGLLLKSSRKGKTKSTSENGGK
jgi:hypothetical protein